MIRHVLALLFLSQILLPMTSHAFDGQRQGFVIGGGGGLSPQIHWSRNVDDKSETGVGSNVQFIVGYAWDETNMLVYQASPSLFESDELNLNVMQGVWAVRWYRYFGTNTDDFGRPRTGWYTMVGAGRSVFRAGRNLFDKVFAPGWGLVAGVGYEYKRHLQVDAAYMIGWGSDDGYDYQHQTLALTLTVLAY